MGDEKRTIRLDDLKGLPGLRRVAADAILAHQPRTVAEAIRLRDVGRKTARALLEAGLITDPEDAMHRSIYDIPLAAGTAGDPGGYRDGQPL